MRELLDLLKGFAAPQSDTSLMEGGHVGTLGRPAEVCLRPFVTLHHHGRLRLRRRVHARLFPALVDDAVRETRKARKSDSIPPSA